MKNKNKTGLKLEKYSFFLKTACRLILFILVLSIPLSQVFAQELVNSQKIALAEPSIGPGVLSGDILDSGSSINGEVLVPQVGPLGSALDVANIPENTGQISVYTVHKGDTIASVAKMFDVTKDTIVYANNLSRGDSLKVGSILTIPTVSGQVYTIKKDSETISSIAKKFKVKASDIAIYNDLDIGSDLSVGDTLIVPDVNFTQTVLTQDEISKNKNTVAEVPLNNADDHSTRNGVKSITPLLHNFDEVDLGNTILRPIALADSTLTQGAHGYRNTGVDLGAKVGTPVVAALDGQIFIATEVGWNGGYGKYVVLMSNVDGHTVQTVYGHLSEVDAVVGNQVKRGDMIGRVGNTGHSFGSHLHFEVRGARNPLAYDRNYTGE